MELLTHQYRQNAQNFGPELLDQVLGPKIQKEVPKYAQAALGISLPNLTHESHHGVQQANWLNRETGMAWGIPDWNG